MRPKVLQVAYACDPEGSGEHWLGWAWAEQAAEFCDVCLLTRPWAPENVRRHAERLGIQVQIVPEVEWVTRLSKNPESVIWLAQYAWQQRIRRVAAEWHAREQFDLVHQTTFHTFRVPFTAAELGVPSVWGPIAGGETIPAGFERFLGPARWSERRRAWLNRLNLWAPWVRRGLRLSSALLVSNRTTLDYLPAWCRAKARIVPANAFRGDLPQVIERPALAQPEVRLVYAGNCIGRRSVPLVVHAMHAAADVPCHLTVAGEGDALEDWKREVAELGMSGRVTFTGPISRAALADLYAHASALVFPGLRDSGGSSLLEAMSIGLPAICLDWGGPAEMVDGSSGFKIPVTSVDETLRAMGDAFRQIHRDPELARQIGLAGAKRCRELFLWEHKRAILEEIYQQVLHR